MTRAVDIVAGGQPASYSLETFRRLRDVADIRILISKGYASGALGTVYRLLDLPLRVAISRRRDAILHVDGQLLAHVLAWPSRGRTVLTCYDIIPLLPQYDDPSYVSRDRPVDSAYYRLLARGIRRANRVIAVSEHVRRDLVHLGVVDASIDVVPMGVNRQVFRPRGPTETRAVRAMYHIPSQRPFILFVGSEHPRKNMEGLLRAFARLSEEVVLVKVGAPRYPQRVRYKRLATELGVRDRVLFIDEVAEDDLARLYASASGLVLPSFYEGFGLPPLEAMACGTPVAVSETTSLPEVVGDAGLYFDPHSDEQIEEALRALLTDEPTRKVLRDKGLERSAQFPWERTVEGILRTYERVQPRLPLPK